MKQVTGSNNISPDVACQSILSIQLVLGGLYFSVLANQNTVVAADKLIYNNVKAEQRLPIIYGDNKFLGYEYQKVNLVVDTARVSPVPHDWIDDDYGDWLTYAGFLPLPHENVVIGRSSDEMAMIMPIDKASDEFLKEQYGDKLNYVHPLQILSAKPKTNSFIALSIEGTEAYVAAVENGKTKCIMPLVLRGPAEIFFCLHKLAEEFKTSPQLLFSTSDKATAEMLSSQFKGSINMNTKACDAALFNVTNCWL